MSPTQSSLTSSVTASQPQRQTSQLQLPPPQTFDVLPALHELLARIDHAEPVSVIPDQSSGDADDVVAIYPDTQSLEPKELPTEVLQTKAKIRKAMKELENLPDMERTVAAQNEEIAELQCKIRRQREMMKKLEELAKGMQEKIG